MSKRLITDRDVLEGRCGARIVLDDDTLLTPSARDRAMRLGIEVVEPGAAPRMPAAASLAHAAGTTVGATPARGAGCARCGTASCGGDCASCAGSGRVGSAAACGTPGCGGDCATCASRAAGAGSAATGAAANLPDGLYLLRVEGGRAVSVLPAAGPGLMPRAQAPLVSRS